MRFFLFSLRRGSAKQSPAIKVIPCLVMLNIEHGTWRFFHSRCMIE